MITNFKTLLASLYQLIAECQAKQGLNMVLVSYTAEFGGKLTLHVTNGEIGTIVSVSYKDEIHSYIHIVHPKAKESDGIISELPTISDILLHSEVYQTIVEAIEGIENKGQP